MQWQPITDQHRENGNIMLVAGYVRNDPTKGRWVERAYYHNGKWYALNGDDEPDGDAELFPPYLVCEIPPLPQPSE